MLSRITPFMSVVACIVCKKLLRSGIARSMMFLQGWAAPLQVSHREWCMQSHSYRVPGACSSLDLVWHISSECTLWRWVSGKRSGTWMRHVKWYSCFCLLLGGRWSRAHRMYLLFGFTANLNQLGQKQWAKGWLRQGITQQEYSPKKMVTVCERISIASWKENLILHFQPRKLLWMHLIKQNISF